MSLLPPYSKHRASGLVWTVTPTPPGSRTAFEVEVALPATGHRGTTVGAVTVEPPRKSGYGAGYAQVDVIAVEAGWRRRGLGLALYRRAAAEACRRWGVALWSPEGRSDDAEAIWRHMIDRSIATFDDSGLYIIPCAGRAG